MTDVPLPEPAFLAERCGMPRAWPAYLVAKWSPRNRESVTDPLFTAEQLRSYAEACVKAERERAQAEVLAWRERFPKYIYRPQDDCVALKMVAMDGK